MNNRKELLNLLEQKLDDENLDYTIEEGYEVLVSDTPLIKIICGDINPLYDSFKFYTVEYGDDKEKLLSIRMTTLVDDIIEWIFEEKAKDSAYI